MVANDNPRPKFRSNRPAMPIPLQIRRYYARKAHLKLSQQIIEFLKTI